MPKLSHYVKCTGEINVLSGMHIGGAKESLKIGGIDNPVIRNPITNSPYIPGSSLKGRFRMALELKYDDYSTDNRGSGPSSDASHESQVCRLFGNADAKKSNEATRLIFRDATLAEGYDAYIKGEEKIEVKMDRKKLAGFQGGNRIQERIAAGARFNFEIMMRIFEGDSEDIFKLRLQEAMGIVEKEYLGGSGSRGYGQVKFENVKFETEKI